MSRILTSLALGLAVFTTSAIRADDVVNEHKKALGKPEAIAKIKSIRRIGEAEFSGAFAAEGTVEESAILGKKAYQKIKMPEFEGTRVWDGKAGWKSNSFAPMEDMQEYEIGQMQGMASIDPFLGKAAEMPSEKLVAGPEKDIEGVACKSYKLNEDMTAYIGKTDHLLHAMEVKVPDPAGGEGKVDVKTVYSEYKEYDGVKFADKIVTTVGDNFVITTKFTKTEINPTLADSLFAKP